jgi:hypothetical protein
VCYDKVCGRRGDDNGKEENGAEEVMGVVVVMVVRRVREDSGVFVTSWFDSAFRRGRPGKPLRETLLFGYDTEEHVT